MKVPLFFVLLRNKCYLFKVNWLAESERRVFRLLPQLGVPRLLRKLFILSLNIHIQNCLSFSFSPIATLPPPSSPTVSVAFFVKEIAVCCDKGKFLSLLTSLMGREEKKEIWKFYMMQIKWLSMLSYFYYYYYYL